MQYVKKLSAPQPITSLDTLSLTNRMSRFISLSAAVAKQSAGEDSNQDDDDELHTFLQSDGSKPRLSMIEFLNE